jgi:hypothetical protein
VCFTYDPAAFRKPANLRLFHGGSTGGWTDITTSNDLARGVICGSTPSFSPFVLAELAYDVTGFFAPVDNPGATNVTNRVKAGAAVPVKFSLGDDFGLGILATGSPSSQSIACGGLTSVDAIEETVSAGESGLTYDAVNRQYVYVWKTTKTWAGSCRRFTLALKDGSMRTALFTFTR